MNTKLIRLTLAILVGIAALTTGMAHAATDKPDQKWYAVEVIVFRPTGNVASGNEIWPPDPKLPSLARAVDPDETTETGGNTGDQVTTFALNNGKTTAADATGKKAVRPLTQSQYQLAGVWQALRQSGRYKPLVHTGWIQPGTPGGKTPKVSITRLARAPEEIPSTATFYAAAALSRPDQHESQSEGKVIAPPDAPAFGTVRLKYDDYLAVSVDIAWRPPHPAAIPTWSNPFAERKTLVPQQSNHAFDPTRMGPTLSSMRTGPKAVVIRQSSRVDPGDPIYFDQPLFGVIVQVTPVEAPDAIANAREPGTSNQRQ